MLQGQLDRRVDLEKLTQDDFRLRGEFRTRDESLRYEAQPLWRLIPGFREEGAADYVPFAQLIPQDRLHECYELIVQTPDRTEIVRSGYLHPDQTWGVSFGIRDVSFDGQQTVHYTNSAPVWLGLVDDAYNPKVNGPVDLIFVKVSPWHQERDAQRERVLHD